MFKPPFRKSAKLKLTLIHTDTNTLKLAMGAGGGILGEANVLRYLARFVVPFVVADFDGDGTSTLKKRSQQLNIIFFISRLLPCLSPLYENHSAVNAVDSALDTLGSAVGKHQVPFYNGKFARSPNL